MKITGVAWLSSVRVVKCWINFLNERNPSFYSKGRLFDSLLNKNTAGDRLEEGRDHVKSS